MTVRTVVITLRVMASSGANVLAGITRSVLTTIRSMPQPIPAGLFSTMRIPFSSGYFHGHSRCAQ
jgi:hypothetical protein